MSIEAPSFRWVYVINHWDIHLNGICKVDDEILFAMLENENPQHTDDLIYGIYRFPPKEKEWFLERKKAFEENVGTHWTYNDTGDRTTRYVPRSQADLERFYKSPKLFDFREVCARSERVYKHTVKGEPEDD